MSPRIRDLRKITLVRDDTPTEIAKKYPHAGLLLGARRNEPLVADCCPDLLRMAGSWKYGQATASLVVGKWSAASRQNTLAAALKEWGTLRRYDPCGEVSVGSGLSSADQTAAEQGRESARAAP